MSLPTLQIGSVCFYSPHMYLCGVACIYMRELQRQSTTYTHITLGSASYHINDSSFHVSCICRARRKSHRLCIIHCSRTTYSICLCPSSAAALSADAAIGRIVLEVWKFRPQVSHTLKEFKRLPLFTKFLRFGSGQNQRLVTRPGRTRDIPRYKGYVTGARLARLLQMRDSATRAM